jgi:hypothetical protein
MSKDRRRRRIIAVVAVLIFLALIIGVTVVSTRMTRSSSGRVVKIDGAATPTPSASPTSLPANTTGGRFVPRAIAWAARRDIK